MLKPWITFQDILEYQFKMPQILEEALTHKSFAHEKNRKTVFSHNERLEFLGDSVLGLCVSNLLMQTDFEASEGVLSKRRASLVNEAVLAQIAREQGLNDYLLLGQGEVSSRGCDKNSILSSTLEAILGAVYLDGGLEPVSKVVHKFFRSRIEVVSQGQALMRDFKTKLQEIVQSRHKITPSYKIDKTSGPEHQKIFQVSVYVLESKLAMGEGRSRKDAEQDAARLALKDMESL